MNLAVKDGGGAVAQLARVGARLDALVLTPLLGPADGDDDEGEEFDDDALEESNAARKSGRKMALEERKRERAAAREARSDEGKTQPEKGEADEPNVATTTTVEGEGERSEDAVSEDAAAALDARAAISKLSSAAKTAAARISASKAADVADEAFVKAGDALDAAEALAAKADRAVSLALDRFAGAVASRTNKVIDAAARAVVRGGKGDAGAAAAANDSAALAQPPMPEPGCRLALELL
jgi:hypothetical protein